MFDDYGTQKSASGSDVEINLRCRRRVRQLVHGSAVPVGVLHDRVQFLKGVEAALLFTLLCQ